MRERTHGHIGIDLPVSGEQESGRGVRPSRRRASGPRPVRPHAPRPESAAAIRRPADPGSAARGSAPGAAMVSGQAARGVAGPARPVGVMGAGRAACGAVDGAAIGGATTGIGNVVGAGWAACAGGAVGAGRAAGADVGGVAAVRRGCGVVADRQARRSVAPGPRLLVSRPRPPAARRARVRRLLAGLALVLAAAAVVVGLGRIADVAAQSRAAETPAVAHVAEVSVTVAAPGTVWDVADGVAPGASGPQRAAMVDRIVVANSLTSLRVWPGEVLRVPL
jgi:hypothetical protein